MVPVLLSPTTISSLPTCRNTCALMRWSDKNMMLSQATPNDANLLVGHRSLELPFVHPQWVLGIWDVSWIQFLVRLPKHLGNVWTTVVVCSSTGWPFPVLSYLFSLPTFISWFGFRSSHQCMYVDRFVTSFVINIPVYITIILHTLLNTFISPSKKYGIFVVCPMGCPQLH